MLAIGKYWRICWVFALLWCALPSAVFANPVGGVVSAGQATIASSAKKVDINQQSNKAVIDWRGFDIAPDETTGLIATAQVRLMASSLPMAISLSSTKTAYCLAIMPKSM